MRSPDPETRGARPVDWIAALRAHLLATAFLDLLWEAAHLPLYTIWMDGTIRDNAFAVLHCTMGDVLIALAALTAALVVARPPGLADTALDAGRSPDARDRSRLHRV